MKKVFASLIAVLAIACIATGLRAANAETPTDLSNVKVTAYQGSKPIISMSGPDCASVYYVLPTDVKNLITDEWNKFNSVAREQGIYAGVKYSFKGDMSFEYNGVKVVASNAAPEMIQKILLLGQQE